MSIVIIRLRSAGIIEQPAEEHGNKQGNNHAEISAEHCSVTLNAVFSEIPESRKRSEEKKKRQCMLPAEAVCSDGTDIIGKENDEQEGKRCYLCNADKGGVGIQLIEKCKVHQRLVGPQRIRQNFNGSVGNQKHLPNIAGTAARIIHFHSPVVVEEGKQGNESDEYQQGFQKEDSRPIRNISGGVRYRDAKRETLQKRNTGDGALPDETAVKQGAEANKKDQKTGSRRGKIEKTACRGDIAKLADNPGGKADSEDDARKTVAADAETGKGGDNAAEGACAERLRILLHIEIPVDQPAEQEGKQNGKRKEASQRGRAWVFRLPEGKRHRDKGKRSAKNHHGGPVNDQIVEINRNGIAVHCVTSSPLIAEAK